MSVEKVKEEITPGKNEPMTLLLTEDRTGRVVARYENVRATFISTCEGKDADGHYEGHTVLAGNGEYVKNLFDPAIEALVSCVATVGGAKCLKSITETYANAVNKELAHECKNEDCEVHGKNANNRSAFEAPREGNA